MWTLFLLVLVSLWPLLVAAQQPVPPSCEEQLAEVRTTLFFTRASRNQGEETAGRVSTTLQKQLEALQHELAALKKVPTSIPPSVPSQDPHS